MTPFASLADLPRQLHQPAVRDLAWALLSPPLLLHAPCSQRHPLSGSLWADEPERLANWLQRLDAAPQPLHEWLAGKPTRRLGLYYERLWQFALQQAPGIEVLAANLPIRLDGQTLGELDLLLRDSSGVHHVELAIKLYLGEPDSGLWIGPGSHDRLDLKLAHLCSHQLPLPDRAEACPVLGALTDAPIRSAMWLSGYLFHPWSGSSLALADVNAGHLQGRWLRRRDWPNLFIEPNARWQPLPRPAWLAPARLPASEGWSGERLQEWKDALPHDAHAQLLVNLQPGSDGCLHERERVFLVADDWPCER